MKFTIRDMLWLTVVVAMGLTWASDRTIVTYRDELIRQHNKSLDELATYWKAESEKEHRNVEYMREVFRKHRLTQTKSDEQHLLNPDPPLGVNKR